MGETEVGDESPRAVLCRAKVESDSDEETLFQDEAHLISSEQAASAGSFPATIQHSNLRSGPLRSVLPALEGYPARSTKRQRLGVDSGSLDSGRAEEMLFDENYYLNLSEQVASTSSFPATLHLATIQQVGGFEFDLEDSAPNLLTGSGSDMMMDFSWILELERLPDDVLVNIMGKTDQRTRSTLNMATRTLRDFLQRNSCPSCGRFMSTIRCQIHTIPSPSGVSTASSLDRDSLLKVLCKLGTTDIARLGRTCAAFRCLLACLESRRFVNQNAENCELLGALISSSALSKYPVLLSSLLPTGHQTAVEMFTAFWRKFAVQSNIQKVEIADCRDGLILLRERNNRITKLVLCSPFTTNRSTITIPELPLDLTQEPSCYVSSTFIPDDGVYNFSIIMLMSCERTSEIVIGRYTLKQGSWRFKKHLWDSQVLLKSRIKLPATLSAKYVYYLQPGIEILAVDLAELNIERIPLPAITAVLPQNHLLVQKRSGMLCLVVITRGKVCLFDYIGSSSSWILSKEFDGLGDETDCRLVGSGTGKILIHAADRLCCMNLVDGRCFDVSIGFRLVREAFCYELQHPPVAEFRRRLQ